ncbi:hypothetical protein WJX72_004408 [[Myrmecia] bisecta]|uniref:Uncharacterized protein n=1 Tax=[Myrmecia] bisecta TaxID=41462 RepID=A0AAW1PSM2_9CHLO
MAQYCPGDDLPDPGLETVTLCDGTEAVCDAICCTGDYCIQCGCTALTGLLTDSEFALQDALCTTIDNSQNLDDFCTIALDNVVSSVASLSETCITAAAQALAAPCSTYFLDGTDSSGSSSSDIPSSPGSVGVPHAADAVFNSPSPRLSPSLRISPFASPGSLSQFGNLVFRRTQTGNPAQAPAGKK